jgi:hypothetical protein
MKNIRSHTLDRDPIYLPRPQNASPDAPRSAYAAFELQGLASLGPKARISRQVLLAARSSKLMMASMGEEGAFELRYIVTPSPEPNDWQSSIRAFLLRRVSRWHTTPAALRPRAQQLADELEQLLESTLPEYHFQPVADSATVKKALTPFIIRDTLEVRRRYLDGFARQPLLLPWQGAIDIESVLDVMLRQEDQTALSLCIAPTHVDDSWDEGTLVPAHLATSANAGQQQMFGDSTAADGETALYLREWQQQMHVRRSLALNIASFRLRIQLSGAARIGEHLAATITREVGGPGLLTAEAAWQTPTLPVADGAVCVRPRSAKLPDQPETEFSIACANMRAMAFTPWAADDTQTEPLFLAHMGEVACMFALPDTGRWLPRQGVVEMLPFRAPVRDGIHLGANRVHGVMSPVCLPQASRNHHTWIVGQTGTGKSTLLENIILQDVLEGRSVIVIDPHGDLIRQVLGKIPEERMRDVVLFDPADKAFPVGLNPLETGDEDEREMMVNAFIDLLIKLYDPHHTGIIGPRFEHGARNVMLTVMSAPGNTLVEVLRAFQDHRFVMQHLLPHVTDPIVRRYWTDQITATNEFHKSEVLDWLVSKFSHFVTDRTMRRILGQSTSSFSFSEAMNSGKIVLLNLAKGRLGSENANFLGLILLPMILRAALSRAGLPDAERRDVSLVVDEFHNYATDSLALMLAEARKYHVGLTLANQHVGQLTGEIRDALLGNVGSILSFRLGATDAVAMESILAPTPISAQHLITLPDYTAYGRLLISGHRTPVFTLQMQPSLVEYAEQRAEGIRELSREAYGRPREEVDSEINRRSNMERADRDKEGGINHFLIN